MLITTARKAINEPTLRSQLRDVFISLGHNSRTATLPLTSSPALVSRSFSSHPQQAEGRDNDSQSIDPISAEQNSLSEDADRPKQHASRNAPSNNGEISPLEKLFQMSVRQQEPGNSSDIPNISAAATYRERPGKRHLERMTSLGIDSLGKPSKVIIIQNVEADEKPTSPDYKVDKQYEEAEILVDHQPQESEILDSIDDLRPEGISLDDAEFDDTLRRLQEGYNKTQLKRYIQEMLPPAGANSTITGADGSRAATMSIWRKGATDLAQRLPLQLATNKSTTTARLAEHIVRVVWAASRRSELQDIGEMEFVLSKPTATYLIHRYALQNDWKPLLTSHLAHSVDITIHEPANALRITARRLDALGAADRLIERLKTITSTQVIFNAAADLKKLLASTAIDEIQQQTETFIERVRNGVKIIGRDASECFKAKRLMCHALHPHPAADHDSAVLKNTYEAAATGSKQSLGLIPFFGQHSDHYAKPLVRPTSLNPDDRRRFYNVSSDSGQVSRMVSAVEAAVKSSSKASDLQAAETLHPEDWSANIGYALRPQRLPPPNQRYATTFTSQLPSIAQVLSFFTTSQSETRGVATGWPAHKSQSSSSSLPSHKVLVAWLIPSPFAQSLASKQNISTLPRLKLSFGVIAGSTGYTSPLTLGPPSIEVAHRLRSYLFNLTDREVDLQLQRRWYTPLSWPPAQDAAQRDDSLSSYIRRVRSAHVSSLSEALTFLLPAHEIQVPLAAVNSESSSSAGNVSYICTHLEAQETHLLRPKPRQSGPFAATAHQLLGTWSPSMHLRLTMTGSEDDSLRREFSVVDLAARSRMQKLAVGSSIPGQDEDGLSGLAHHSHSDSPLTAAQDDDSAHLCMSNLITSSLALIDLSTALSRRVI